MGDGSARSEESMASGQTLSNAPPTRRSALQSLLGWFLVITGATFVAPVLSYLSPRKAKGGRNVLLDREGRPFTMKELDGQTYLIGQGVDGEPTIVVRYAGELRAFSAVCPHLGCLVKWTTAPIGFLCPCHAGRFDADGVNVSGPPPSPLKRFRAQVTADGQIGLEKWAA